MATEQNPAGGEADAAAGIVSELTGDQSFDQEFNAFLGHSFEDDDATGDESNPNDPPAGSEEASTPPATPPAEPTPEAPANAAPTAANGTPPAQPAPADPKAAQEPAIDPADLAAVMGFAAPTAKTEPAPAAPAAAPAGAAPAEPEPFAPFTADFRLPDQIVAGIFEAEDTESRHKALVSLLASFGNAVTQTVEQRILKHHAPAMQTAFVESVQSRQAATAVNQHFYGTYSDLQPYVPAVAKAFEVIAAKNPGAQYTPELAAQVATLARQALKAAGIQLAAPASPAAPTGTPPAPKKAAAKAAPVFEAGGARPGNFAPSDGNSPEALLTELTQFGF